MSFEVMLGLRVLSGWWPLAYRPSGPALTEGTEDGRRVHRETERHGWEEEDWIGLTAAGCPENNIGSISVWIPATCERLLSERNEKAPPCCEAKGQRRSECSFISDKEMVTVKHSLLTVRQ